MRLILFSFISLSAFVAAAAPYPATSSSILTSPERGLAFLQKGFLVKTAGTEWVPVNPEKGSESLLDTIRFEPKDAKQTGSLSIRTDKILSTASLELYAKKFMRDYPNYGFDVLSSKPVKLNENSGLLVDMVSRTKNKQLRQLILKQNNQVAILTCLDEKENFNKTLSSCNQIMKSFEWTDPANTSPSPAQNK